MPTCDAASFEAGVFELFPFAFWKFDEDSGTVAADSSGNGYDGTYNGGVTLGVAGPLTGETAASFDGTDDYFESTLPFTGLKTLTVGMWLNWDTFADDNRTLLDRGGQTDEVAIKITPNSDYSNNFSVEMWGADGGSGGYALAYCTRPTTGWQFVVVTFDIDDLQQNSAPSDPRSKMRVWFADSDSCVEQTLTWTQDSGFTEGKTFDDTTPLRLMHPPQNNGSNQPWDWFQGAHAYGQGDAAYLMLFDRVLTESEICGLLDCPSPEVCNLRTVDEILLVDASNQDVTVTIFDGEELPAIGFSHIWYIKRIDDSANTVTVDPSPWTIDGLTTLTLEPWDAIALVTDGYTLYRL